MLRLWCSLFKYKVSIVLIGPWALDIYEDRWEVFPKISQVLSPMQDDSLQWARTSTILLPPPLQRRVRVAISEAPLTAVTTRI